MKKRKSLYHRLKAALSNYTVEPGDVWTEEELQIEPVTPGDYVIAEKTDDTVVTLKPFSEGDGR